MAADVSPLTALVATFTAKYELCQDKATKTEVTTEEKRLAEIPMVAKMRELGQRIQANKSVSEALKVGLSLNPRDVEPTSIGVPPTKPVVTVRSSADRTIKCRAADELTPNKRAKPFGVDGLKVWSHVGAEPPASINDWVFEGLSTRGDFSVVLPASVAPGSKVWICAAWYNPRGQSGAIGNPVFAYCVGGVSTGDAGEGA